MAGGDGEADGLTKTRDRIKSFANIIVLTVPLGLLFYFFGWQTRSIMPFFFLDSQLLLCAVFAKTVKQLENT